MKKYYAKNAKVGDIIYIVDTEFNNAFTLKYNIYKAFVYRKEGLDASYKFTKEDRYENMFHSAYLTKEDAYKGIIKELREKKVYDNKRINNKISEITKLI